MSYARFYQIAAFQAYVEQLKSNLQLDDAGNGLSSRETFRSTFSCATDTTRAAATNTINLQQGENTLAFRRSRSDEVFYWHSGTSNLIVHIVTEDGAYSSHIIGKYNEVYDFDCPIPAGCWFAFQNQTTGNDQFSLFSSVSVMEVKAGEQEFALPDRNNELTGLCDLTLLTNLSTHKGMSPTAIKAHFNMGDSATCGFVGGRYDGAGQYLTEDRLAAGAVIDLIYSDINATFHRTQFDQIMFYHHGSCDMIVEYITEAGEHKTKVLNEKNPAFVMEKNQWFAFRKEGDEESDFIVSSHMAIPAFDINDFEPGNRGELLETYPEHRDIIVALTPEPEGPNPPLAL